jgi:DNA polymerase III delta subunit
MLEIWVGNEPFLMYQQNEKDTSDIPFPDMNFTKGELDEKMYESCYISPFLAEKRYVLGYATLGNKFLEKLIDEAETIENDVKIILEGDIDKRKSVYKKAQKKKVIRSFDRLDQKKFNEFCLFCLGGAKITEDDYRYLKDRMAYGKRPDADLYTVRAWLGAVASAPQPVERKVIDHIIPEYTGGDAFGLFSFLISKDSESYFKLLDKLLDDDPHAGIQILSVLLRNFRLAYKVALVGVKDAEKEIGVEAWKLKSMTNVTMESAKEAMKLLQKGVNDIKKGLPARQLMSEISVRLLNLV